MGRQKDASPGWSRDGRHVLLLSDRREEPWFGPEDATLYAVSPDRDAPADTKDLTEVADVVGPISAFAEDSAGRIAAVVAFAQDPPRTYDQHDLVLFEGEWPRRSPRVLLEGQDLEVGEGITSDQHPPRGGGAMPLAFTADERGVLCVITRRGAARLAIVARGGSLTWCTDERHEVVAGSVTPDGRKVALVIGDPRTPGELCVYDVAKGSLTRLFAPNEALLTGARLGEVEEIDYPSFDGRAIHGWIVKPPDFDPSKRYPLILEIHGGPHSAYGVAFFHEFQVLAEAGYVVLYTNPRGSTSYGQSFADCIQYCYPGDDAKDLLAGVDALIARGYVDETRMGVTGGSGGGLLTNWVVANTDRFRAAITQRCVSEWMSFWYSCDFALFPPFWFRKPPFENPQEYLDRSPVTFASRITTPLMVIHSEEDWRTPIGQGEAMFRALKHQRKPTVMVRFPGENHELSRSGTPSRRVQNQEHIRRWFDHWLRDVPAPQYEV